MRPCTLRIASAEDDTKATSLTAALVEHAPWCRTAPNALPLHIKPLAGSMRVVVVPRWGGTPSDDWYPWAAAELEQEGVSLEALELPDPAQPEIEAWIAAVAAGLAAGVPAETVLVGHSVGCRAALGAVERLPDGVRLHGLLLVAAWWDVDAPWPSILPWQALEHDAVTVRAAVGRPHVLLSDDDPFTSDWRRNSDQWVERLDAGVRVCEGARHFNAAHEPAVLAAIRELL